MEENDRKAHWEKIYSTKVLTDVSWYQPLPETSINLLKSAHLSKEAKIIDVGGGDSFFVDYLLNEGYTNITVLDISEKALERAKTRLGEKAQFVRWIVADIASFVPEERYDFWHDRAAFHFLTHLQEIEHYRTSAVQSIRLGGHLVIGTFSELGPLKCSGIPIKQYSRTSLNSLFSSHFQLIDWLEVDHNTPFNSVQHFVFCVFKRNEY